MWDEQAIAAIRAAVAIGDYEIHLQHSDEHADEGIALPDAEYVMLHGDVIEYREESGRWLFCDVVASLRQDARFRGRWLHVAVQYDDEDTTVVVVTMYRPLVHLWITEKKRRARR
ncbi:MAG: DUF4258 domain-containing protein [Thermomicrobiales bacterium]